MHSVRVGRWSSFLLGSYHQQGIAPPGPLCQAFSWYLSLSDAEGTLIRVPLSCPCDKVLVPPLIQVWLDGRPSRPVAAFSSTCSRGPGLRNRRSLGSAVTRWQGGAACSDQPKPEEKFISGMLGCPMDPEGRKCSWPGARNWEIRGWVVRTFSLGLLLSPLA